MSETSTLPAHAEGAPLGMSPGGSQAGGAVAGRGGEGSGYPKGAGECSVRFCLRKSPPDPCALWNHRSARGQSLRTPRPAMHASGPLRGTSPGRPCISHHWEEKGLVYRVVCRGPPAGQERQSYVEFKWEAAGNDSDVSPSRASATRDGQGRPR